MVDIIKKVRNVHSKQTNELEKATDDKGNLDVAALFEAPEFRGDQDLTHAVEAVKAHRGMTDEELYKKEYQLKAMHKLVLHGATTSDICNSLKITSGEVKSLKREMNARVISAARKMDKYSMAGETIMYYDLIIAESMKMSSSLVAKPKREGEAPESDRTINSRIRTKVEVLKLGLQAQTDKQRFLTAAGFWNNGLGDGNQEDSYSEGANELRDIINTVLTGDTFEMSDITKEDDDDIRLF